MLDAINTKTTVSAATADPDRISVGNSKHIVKVGGVWIGGNKPVVIAGPCSVESQEQIDQSAMFVKKAGATILRGGAFKPRTSPHSFQGLGLKGLELLRSAGDKSGLAIVTELLSESDAEAVAEVADMIQIGARNMQNFALLKKVAKFNKPVLLKRGPASTIQEWLSAAEYILSGGNPDVVLCERGIRGFDPELRNTLDLASVALVKEMCKLPVIVDPSHATGRRSLIGPLSRAAIAVGADGLIIEVHPDPATALSDSEQQLDFKAFEDLMNGLSTPPPSVFCDTNSRTSQPISQPV